MARTVALAALILALTGAAAPVLRDGDRQLERGDATLHYRILGAGHGPVLVMLSGGPGFSIAYLQAAAAHLSGANTVVELDQRGTGASTVRAYDAATISIAKNIDDLDALRTELGLDRLRIFGHSWGAMLAMAYAVAHPDRVERLVLSDSGGPDTGFAQAAGARLALRTTDADRAATAKWRDQMSGPDAAIAARNFWIANTGPYLDNRTVVAELVPMEPHIFDSQVGQLMQADMVKHYDLSATLHTVTAPTLIILGRDDIVGVDTSERIHGLMPNSQMVIVEDAGHFPFVERPAPYYAALDPFLAKDPR
jgi:proline iminopeptidase